MQEVEKVVKSIKDVKTDVNPTNSNQATMENASKRLKSNSELGSKIGLWLDKKVDLQEVLLCLTSQPVFKGSQGDCTQEVLLPVS